MPRRAIKPAISVLVADSQRLFAESVAASLEGVFGLITLPELPLTGVEAVQAAIDRRPDVVVLDYWIGGGLDGPAATEAILDQHPETKVLLMSWLHGRQHVERSMDSGACGFLPKSLSISQLADAIRRAEAGEKPVYGQELTRLVETIDKRANAMDESQRRFAALSDREREVVALLVQRRSAERVAKELFVSPGTIRNQIQVIRRAVGAQTQDDLIRLARKVAPHLLGRSMPPSGGWRSPARISGGISVLVADEQRLLAEALSHALSRSDQVAVTGVQFGNGADALQLAVSSRPDIVLYDYWMPGTTGPALARYLAKWAPASTVVMLSWLHGASQISRAAAWGAGLVSKRVTVDELVTTVIDAHAGRTLSNAEVLNPRAARVLDADDDGHDVWDRLSSLTPREVAVLHLLSNGATRLDITRSLRISPGTAKNHVTNLLRKLEVQSKLEAVELARGEGLVCEIGAPASTSSWSVQAPPD